MTRMVDIRLPKAYSPSTRDNLSRYVSDLFTFLASPIAASFIHSHPNDVTSDNFQVPEIWKDWWGWAASDSNMNANPPGWKSLVELAFAEQEQNSSNKLFESLPPSLVELAHKIRSIALPRSSTVHLQNGPTPAFLMKEKKAHEVNQMSAYVGQLAKEHSIRHAVDIGAGQGYLTKAIASAPHSMNVLALESSTSQIAGSRQRDALKKKSKAVNELEKETHSDGERRITYKRMRVNGSNLIDAIDRWVGNDLEQLQDPYPVLLMGLHTCGGLTPSIIRTYLASCKRRSERGWYAAGLVVVGCCYHLVGSQDFPMSQQCTELVNKHRFDLRHDHLMLASQTPATWLKNERSFQEAKISLRKIAYRAVYACLDRRCTELGLSRAEERVYRVRWRECQTFEGYIAAANARQKGDTERLNWLLSKRSTAAMEGKMMGRVQVLQTMRCLLGAVTESMLLVDRFLALLPAEVTGNVGLIALFDMRENSPRNMALVVRMKDGT